MGQPSTLPKEAFQMERIASESPDENTKSFNLQVLPLPVFTLNTEYMLIPLYSKSVTEYYAIISYTAILNEKIIPLETHLNCSMYYE